MAVILKSRTPEISNLISLGICLTIIALSVTRLEAIMDMIKKITEYITVDKLYLNILLKLIGISYVCEFAASISKDAGYQAAASQIELVGKLTMLMVSMPVVMNVIDTIASLLE